MIQLLRSSLATKIMRVSGVFPNNALSVAAKNKILLKNIKRISCVCFEAEILANDEVRIRKLLADNYKIEILSKKGAAYTAKRIAKRVVLLTGILLSITALFVLSRRVMVINVYGSDDKQIYNAVEQAGIFSWHQIAQKNVNAATNAVMQIDGVVWVNIEIKGICANVFVEQEKVETETTFDGQIIALRDGVVKNIIVYSGTPLVKNGDTVFSGQVLVENYEMRGEEKVSVEAKAKVLTQTWYVQSESIELVQQKRIFTKKQKIKTEIDLFGKNFTFDKGEEFSDSIENKKELFCSFLPIKITQTLCREVKTQSVQIDVNAAARQAEIDLCEKLMLEISKDCNVIDKNVEVFEGDGCINVSVCFLVLEDVAGYQ